MKMADGGFRPADNVQLTCDTRSGAIARVSVDNFGSDMGKMAPMNVRLADGGFARLADIAALAQVGVGPFVPVSAPRTAGQDRYAPRPDDPPAVAGWRERMNTAEAREIGKRRAAPWSAPAPRRAVADWPGSSSAA